MNDSRLVQILIHLQAQETIQLASISSEYEYLDQPLEGTEDDPAYNMSPFMSSTYRPCIPQSKFDVSVCKLLDNYFQISDKYLYVWTEKSWRF